MVDTEEMKPEDLESFYRGVFSRIADEIERLADGTIEIRRVLENILDRLPEPPQ